MITDRQAKHLSNGNRLSEKIGGRGEGSLFLESRNGLVSTYFRYTHEGKRCLVSIGVIGADTTLKKARERARDLSGLLSQHPDLKGWLELKALQEKRDHEEAVLKAEAAARRGSLADLLMDYINNLRRQNKRSTYQVESFFLRNVFEAQPHISTLRACDVGPVDIRNILAPVWHRGAHVNYNRGRSYLMSAFQYGLTHEHDVARQSEKIYGLTYNPVAALPRHAEVERACERALTDAELKQFYSYYIGEVSGVGVIVSTFFKFCIATGGQRPTQLLVAPWEAYDLTEDTLRIEDRKGRAGLRIHLIPLTDRAKCLLQIARMVNDNFSHPWTSFGVTPLTLPTLKNAINRFLQSPYGTLEGQQIQHFTARDLRRSVKQLALRARIEQPKIDLLQNHAQGGLVGRHYLNDPTAKLPLMRDAMQAWDVELSRILM